MPVKALSENVIVFADAENLHVVFELLDFGDGFKLLQTVERQICF